MEAYERLEREWGEYCGVPHVVACSSGTAALHLALETLRYRRGWREGDWVLVPEFTMVACARAVVLAGLKPTFVDCRADNLLMDLGVLDCVPPATTRVWCRAVMPVHIYGRVCDMDAVAGFANRCGLDIVEDLAECHWVKPDHRTDAACWSFYRNKVVRGEEGGAVAFRDPENAATARSLRCLGFTPEHDFTHLPRGHNYRLANALAEPILNSLRLHRPDGPILYTPNMPRPMTAREQRREVEAWYDAECPEEWRMPPRQTPWVYDLRIPGLGAERLTRVVRALRDRGVEARHGFKPMSRLPEFAAPGSTVLTHAEGGRTQADAAAEEVLYLPIRPGVTTQEEAGRCFRLIRAALKA